MNAPLDTAAIAAPDRILRLPEVLRRTGLSTSTLYRRIAAGEFPRAVSLGGQSVGWRLSTIEAWLASRTAAQS